MRTGSLCGDTQDVNLINRSLSDGAAKLVSPGGAVQQGTNAPRDFRYSNTGMPLPNGHSSLWSNNSGSRTGSCEHHKSVLKSVDENTVDVLQGSSNARPEHVNVHAPRERDVKARRGSLKLMSALDEDSSASMMLVYHHVDAEQDAHRLEHNRKIGELLSSCEGICSG